MSEQLYCVLDYETYSEVDLKKSGAYEYAAHSSTEILCVAYRVGTKAALATAPTLTWDSVSGDQYGVKAFGKIIDDPRFILIAHNAGFEQVITRFVLPKYTSKTHHTPPTRWMCTASFAAALALPRSLEGACMALNMDVKKDIDGRALMLKMCKPKKPSKADPSTRRKSADDMKRLVEYCAADIAAEVGLFLKLPPLSVKEREIWLLDQKINQRGVFVDVPLVKKVLGLIETETALLNAETQDLTFGAPMSATQRDATLAWLRGEGISLPDLRKNTVSDALEGEIDSEDAKRLLEIRAAISKTSTAKFVSFEARTRSDGRARDNLMYHGSSTGRWSATGVQLQNLPRSVLVKNSKLAAEILATSDLETIRMLYGDPMTVFSDCLRSMIIAPPGHTLDVCDFASIEVRVLFWLARHDLGLSAYEKNADLYRLLASEIYGKPADKISPSERFLGKSATLGCGYGMGASKFKTSCEDQGAVVSEELASRAVKAYRATHAPVPALWKSIEAAARYAIENKGKVVTMNRTKWCVASDFLWCELPSGRRLAYYKPRISWESTPWGEKKAVIYHMGSDSITKQWREQKTWGGVLVENCFAGNTLLLTDGGLKPISKILNTDLVFDGYDFVKHGGLKCQGKKKVIQWLNTLVTPEHLIHDGISWKCVTHLDAVTTQKVLKWGRVLVRLWLLRHRQGSTLSPSAAATAELRKMSAIGAFSEDKRPRAANVGLKTGAKNAPPILDTLELYQIHSYASFGCIGILGLFLGAIMRSTGAMKTMGREILECFQRGSEALTLFLDMQSRSPAGTTLALTSIGLITTRAISPEIYDLSPARKIVGTNATTQRWNTWGKPWDFRLLRKPIAPNGRARIALGTISVAEEPPKKWSRYIEKTVYDIIDCGPRKQFVVMTGAGPIVAHNCTQATARDLMADAMLRIEKAGPWEIVLSVHDELIAQRKKEGASTLQMFNMLMATTPEWAEGCPIAVEGFSSERYRK